MTEKPVAIVLPNWNDDDPRFIVKDCPKCSTDRAFKNNKCIYNQRLGFCYSAEETVEVLNNLNDEIDKLKQKNEKWKEKYFTMGEMFSKQVDIIDEVNNILAEADKMDKEELINKIDKELNND